jgi:hypothetical protein
MKGGILPVGFFLLLAWLPAWAGSRVQIAVGGLILAVMGVLALANVGRLRLPPPWLMALGLAALILPLMGLLPVAWFPPGWVERLVEGDVLPWMRTPSFYLWLEGWGLAWLTVVWTWLLCSWPWEHAERRMLIRGMVVMVGVLAVVSLIDWGGNGELISWWNFARWGPFANRNQFGTVLALGGVLSGILGWHDWKRGRVRAWLWWAGSMALLGCLVLVGSRGGLVAMVGGIVGYGAWNLRKKREGWSGAVGLISLVVIFGVLLVFVAEGQLGRWLDRAGWVGDSRWSIYPDVWRMAWEHRSVGVGLGGFPVLYPLYRDALRGTAPVLHPESDFLWWAVELGWLPLLGLLGLLFWGIWREKDAGEKLVGGAAMGALVLYGFHGLVDVGMHRVGSFLPLATLLGLWWSQSAVSSTVRTRFRWAVGLGLTSLVMGSVLVGQGMGWLPGSKEMEINGRLFASGEEVERERQVAAAERILEIQPYHPRAQFVLGWHGQGMGQRTGKARERLWAAQRWAPENPAVAYESGALFVDDDPHEALQAWREALNRIEGNHLDELLLRMGQFADGRPMIRQGLLFLTANDPRLGYWGWEQRSDTEFQELRSKVWLLGAESLKGRSNAQRGWVRGMIRHEGRDRTVEILRENPDWENLLWPVLAQEWAGQGDPAGATSYVLDQVKRKHGGIPTLNLEDVRADRVRIQGGANDPTSAVRVANAALTSGDYAGAIAALEGVERTAVVCWILAEANLRLGKNREAWDAMASWVRDQQE